MSSLRWYHVGWLFASIYILIATASANGRYQLNHFLATDIWRGVSDGIPRLFQYQENKAQEIDKFSKDRWIPKAPNTQGCAEIPQTINYISKAKVTELNLSLPQSRGDVIDIVGKPYCQLESGDRWVLNDGSFVDVNYDPVRINLKNAAN